MKKYFEIPQVHTIALDPENSIMAIESANLTEGNNVSYTNKLADYTSGEYNIWKGFKK